MYLQSNLVLQHPHLDEPHLNSEKDTRQQQPLNLGITPDHSVNSMNYFFKASHVLLAFDGQNSQITHNSCDRLTSQDTRTDY